MSSRARLRRYPSRRRAPTCCAGQAFHWFDSTRAGAEFARVLRPGGILVAGWNVPTEDGSWYDAVVEYLETENPSHLPATERDWTADLGALAGYEGLYEVDVPARAGDERGAFTRLLGTQSAISAYPRAAGRRDRGARAVAAGRAHSTPRARCAIPLSCEL